MNSLTAESLCRVLLVSLLFASACSLKEEPSVSLEGQWLFKTDSLGVGLSEGWFAEGYDRSGWSSVHVPASWDTYGLEAYDGAGWFAKSFTFTDTTQRVALFFGGIDDDAEVWLNGKKLGVHFGYSEPFYFDINNTVAKSGENELVVRVNDHGGPGGIYKTVAVTPIERVQELLKSKYAELDARPTADWVRDGVVYEVYLRSFSQEGTFKALEHRLGELKELGVSIIWLMPIHPVGELNRKGTLGSPYAVQDYYEVNPEFGTLEDFKSLVKAAHDQGMRIIIDLVANHTAWDCKLVMEHPEWFTTNAEGALVSPNADWTDVADLNYNHHELRKYMIEMMKYWVRDIGIDGFRCDVAELVPTDFWERARKELDKIKPILMISEGTLPEHHLEAFDMTYSWSVYDMLGPTINGTTPVAVFDEILQAESYRFPKGSLRLRFNTNHDKNAYDAPAVLKYGRQGAKAAAVLIFTFPGVPLVYNGEEAGNDKKLDLFEKVGIDWRGNHDFRDLYQKLGALRRDHAALRRGEYLTLKNSGSAKVFSFARQYGGDVVVVIINFDQTPQTVEMSLPPDLTGELIEYFSGMSFLAGQRTLRLSVDPLGYKILLPTSGAARQ